MGLFSGPKKTWAELAGEVPSDRATWIISLGVSRVLNAGRPDQAVNDAVAEVESSGWTLVSLVPVVTGSSAAGIGGNTETTLMGHFRRR